MQGGVLQQAAKVFLGIMAAMFLGITALFLGCSKEAGPVGPEGKAGADGVAKCGICHSVSTTILARQVQWENSMHATGGHFDRNSTSCAPCHTHEGFRETLGFTHPKTVGAPPNNPTPQNCRTCHNIHQNFDGTDYKLATSAPVNLVLGGTYDSGKSNLCAECHQARPVNPKPALNGPDVQITNFRWGPHYGVQSSMLLGAGAYEIPGSVAYENSPHATMVADGCVTCHMATPYGNKAGGHTMKMAYEYGGGMTPNMAGCVSCHTTAKNFDINSVQTEVAALKDELKALLIAAQVLDANEYAVVGAHSADKAGILLNYQLTKYDRSYGVHNAKYQKALLKNSIEYMKK